MIFKSSIRIYNLGTIIKDIDPIKFASGNVGSKIRNILISDVLYKYGYIDAFGTGFDRTFTLCAKNDINYSYNNDDFGFTFIFYRKKDFLENEINIKPKLNLIDENIISHIRGNKYVTISELSVLLNKSEATIYRHLNFLMNDKKIKRIGLRKNGYWKIL